MNKYVRKSIPLAILFSFSVMAATFILYITKGPQHKFISTHGPLSVSDAFRGIIQAWPVYILFCIFMFYIFMQAFKEKDKKERKGGELNGKVKNLPNEKNPSDE